MLPPLRTALFALTLSTSALVALPAAANTIAITEIHNNPSGVDSGREFIELYNYGASPVNVGNWRLSDRDGDLSILLAGTLIQPCDFLIVVSGGNVDNRTAAQSKAAFEAEWNGGVADPRVVGVATGTGASVSFGDNTDELVLTNPAGSVEVYSIAYSNDGSQTRTAYLTGNDFSISVWGTDESAPGIDRVGPDTPSRFAGDLGYELSTSGVDGAFTSDLARIQSHDPLYTSASAAAVGSPLRGPYRCAASARVPAFGPTGLLALGALLLVIQSWIGSKTIPCLRAWRFRAARSSRRPCCVE